MKVIVKIGIRFSCACDPPAGVSAVGFIPIGLPVLAPEATQNPFAGAVCEHAMLPPGVGSDALAEFANIM